MKWHSAQVEKLISSRDVNLSVEKMSISIFQLDADKKIGIGIDGSGELCLIVPAQPESLGFVTKFALFDPITSVFWQEQAVPITDIAILRCKLDLSDPVVTRSVAAIIAGVIDIQLRFDEVGSVLWTMKALFENGFVPSFSREQLVGLIGELMVIDASSQPSNLIDFWHSDPSAKFDFSSESLRLEVKTTTSNLRHHYVSSTQMISNSTINVLIASIKIEEVERGMSFYDLFSQLIAKLNPREQLEVTRVVTRTLGMPPSAVFGLNFDETTSKASLNFYDKDEIPFPALPPGVLSATCLVSFDDCQPSSVSIEAISFK